MTCLVTLQRSAQPAQWEMTVSVSELVKSFYGCN